MKRLIMIAALALLPSAAPAGLSIEDRMSRDAALDAAVDAMSQEQKDAWMKIIAVAVSVNVAMVYVYDKRCEILSKEFIEDNIKWLNNNWDQDIVDRSMKDMEETYRKEGNETFCKEAKQSIERIREKGKSE